MKSTLVFAALYAAGVDVYESANRVCFAKA